MDKYSVNEYVTIITFVIAIYFLTRKIASKISWMSTESFDDNVDSVTNADVANENALADQELQQSSVANWQPMEEDLQDGAVYDPLIGVSDESIDHYVLDDGANGKMLLQNNQCSQACCSKQYPVPFDMPVDAYVAENMNDFVPSSYSCNNSFQNTGCLCMKKEQAGFIASHGNNQ